MRVSRIIHLNTSFLTGFFLHLTMGTRCTTGYPLLAPFYRTIEVAPTRPPTYGRCSTGASAFHRKRISFLRPVLRGRAFVPTTPVYVQLPSLPLRRLWAA